MGVPVLHNYYASCTPYTQSTNVFRLRLSRGWTILAGIWHGCLNPAWVAGGLDLRTTFARVPAAPNDVIACGVHTSVNPAGTSRVWRHPPEISSSSVCVFVWANSVATDRHPSPPPARQQRTPRLAKQTRIDDRSGSGKWGAGVHDARVPRSALVALRWVVQPRLRVRPASGWLAGRTSFLRGDSDKLPEARCS